jgi:hypothetical protein
VLDNVRSENRFWRYDRATGAWSLTHTLHGEGVGSISANGVNGDRTDDIWTTSSSYVLPTTYSLAHADSPQKEEKLKALPAFYNADGLKAEQLHATSLDGTTVPYFLVSRADAPRDGSTPTLLCAQAHAAHATRTHATHARTHATHARTHATHARTHATHARTHATRARTHATRTHATPHTCRSRVQHIAHHCVATPNGVAHTASF